MPIISHRNYQNTQRFSDNLLPRIIRINGVDKTPYEMWCNKKPVLAHIKIWGCPAYVKRIESDKLGAKSGKCLFMGYPKETRGYYFYNPSEQKVFVSKHATILEKEFLQKESCGSKIELDEVHDPQMDMDQPTDPEPITHADEVIGDRFFRFRPTIFKIILKILNTFK